MHTHPGILDESAKNLLQWMNDGITHYQANRYEETLAVYELVIQFNPYYSFAYSNKGIALNRLGRYEEALAAYEQTIELDPNYAYLWKTYSLASIATSSGVQKY